MGRLLALSSNIRLERNWFSLKNSVTYNNVPLITTVKSFMVQAHKWFYKLKHFYPHINTMGRLLAFTTNVRLSWNRFTNENSLGYNTVPLITTVKSFVAYALKYFNKLIHLSHHGKGRLLALPKNIRRGWNWFTLKNSVTYNTVPLITTVKSFMV